MQTRWNRTLKIVYYAAVGIAVLRCNTDPSLWNILLVFMTAYMAAGE